MKIAFVLLVMACTAACSYHDPEILKQTFEECVDGSVSEKVAIRSDIASDCLYSAKVESAQ